MREPATPASDWRDVLEQLRGTSQPARSGRVVAQTCAYSNNQSAIRACARQPTWRARSPRAVAVRQHLLRRAATRACDLARRAPRGGNRRRQPGRATALESVIHVDARDSVATSIARLPRPSGGRPAGAGSGGRLAKRSSVLQARYKSALRATVAASAAPYGYTLTIWTTGAVLSHARGIRARRRPSCSWSVPSRRTRSSEASRTAASPSSWHWTGALGRLGWAPSLLGRSRDRRGIAGRPLRARRRCLAPGRVSRYVALPRGLRLAARRCARCSPARRVPCGASAGADG